MEERQGEGGKCEERRTFRSDYREHETVLGRRRMRYVLYKVEVLRETFVHLAMGGKEREKEASFLVLCSTMLS